MADDPMTQQTLWSRRARQAGAVAQGLILGFLVVLAGMELASLAGALNPFKYQGF